MSAGRRTSSSRRSAHATLPTVSSSVTERTEANLRWANNALTTNGEMRSSRAHRDLQLPRSRADSVRHRQSGGRRTRREVATVVGRRRTAGPHRAARRGRDAAGGRTTPTTTVGRARRRRRASRCFERLRATALGEAFERAEAARAAAVRLRRA